MTRTTTWWHGGVDGLEVGDVLVPASELPRRPATYDFVDYPADPTKVYVTSDYLMAMGYASQWSIPGGGSLYEVKPVGELEEDPDFAGLGVCYTTSRAEIVRVAARSVEMSLHEHTRAQGRFLTWTDGTPVYDRDGWFQPSPEMRAIGIRRDDLRVMGRWFDWQLGHEVVVLATAQNRRPAARDVEAVLRFGVERVAGALG